MRARHCELPAFLTFHRFYLGMFSLRVLDTTNIKPGPLEITGALQIRFVRIHIPIIVGFRCGCPKTSDAEFFSKAHPRLYVIASACREHGEPIFIRSLFPFFKSLRLHSLMIVTHCRIEFSPFFKSRYMPSTGTHSYCSIPCIITAIFCTTIFISQAPIISKQLGETYTIGIVQILSHPRLIANFHRSIYLSISLIN